MKDVSRAVGYLLLQILIVANCLAQVPAEGSLFDYITLKISALPSTEGNNYLDATNGQKEAWNDAMELVLQNDLVSASEILSGLGYRLVHFLETASNTKYSVIEREVTSQNHWGIYVISQNPCRDNVVIQCPHPMFDTNTGKQGIFTFLELDAKALFIGGTHRCNSGSLSSCSGTTTACGANGPFRISDQAHNADGIFQKTTEFLLQANPSTVFIQFHGFGKRAGDPNAILSNGTRVTPQTDYISELIAEMNTEDPTLTFRAGHLDLDWERLLAFTNTQGRLINGSSEPCRTGSSVSQGQFIHVEQELAMFRSDQTGWVRWIEPMKRVFDCIKTEPLTSDQFYHDGLIYPNPFDSEVTVQDSYYADLLMVYNATGQLILELKPRNWKKIDLSTLTSGIYYYQILDKNLSIISNGKMVKTK
ncbi:MAG: T9SS type A sorting domain-containing protein [Cyclobacteriaceae bacterium]